LIGGRINLGPRSELKACEEPDAAEEFISGLFQLAKLLAAAKHCSPVTSRLRLALALQ
jgi:hypothetical protein